MLLSPPLRLPSHVLLWHAPQPLICSSVHDISTSCRWATMETVIYLFHFSLWMGACYGQLRQLNHKALLPQYTFMQKRPCSFFPICKLRCQTRPPDFFGQVTRWRVCSRESQSPFNKRCHIPHVQTSTTSTSAARKWPSASAVRPPVKYVLQCYENMPAGKNGSVSKALKIKLLDLVPSHLRRMGGHTNHTR